MAEASQLDTYYDALQKADAAGDTAGAQKIADYIRTQEAKPSGGKTESLEVSGADTIARGISDFFSPQEKKDVTAPELGGAVAGGAAAGGVAGTIMPQVLQAAGKVLPGALGRGATALGASMGRLPAKERALQGAGGGAVMGAVEKGGEAVGASPALQLGASFLGGGLGETAASFLAKEGKQILSVFGNAAMGNVAGSARALKGMMEPNKPLNLETAKRVQGQLFGEKTSGHIDNLVQSDAKIATAKGIREADSSLPSLQDNPAPASQIYRERMFEGVTESVKKGDRFSSTPEFKTFKDELGVLVKLGEVSPGEARSLIRNLQADGLKPQVPAVLPAQNPGYLRNLTTPTPPKPQGPAPKPDPKVLEGYAEMVDNRIRQWGKPQETGGQVGAAAVDAKTAREVREKLRTAYNGYLGKIGLGNVEEKYRTAYSQEMTAEAMDKLPYFLKGFGQAKEFQSMVRSVGNDPQALPVVQKALTRHLANTEPQAIAGEFERLQKVLVTAKLVTPTDLRVLREASDVVKDITDKGLKQKYGLRLKQMMLLRASGATGVGVGGAAGEKLGRAGMDEE